jgi:hypothetical protein
MPSTYWLGGTTLRIGWVLQIRTDTSRMRRQADWSLESSPGIVPQFVP